MAHGRNRIHATACQLKQQNTVVCESERVNTQWCVRGSEREYVSEREGETKCDDEREIHESIQREIDLIVVV